MKSRGMRRRTPSREEGTRGRSDSPPPTERSEVVGRGRGWGAPESVARGGRPPPPPRAGPPPPPPARPAGGGGGGGWGAPESVAPPPTPALTSFAPTLPTASRGEGDLWRVEERGIAA
jgi:hypothetical protein